jgi:thiol-disulfide isomerase/thioredoxin
MTGLWVVVGVLVAATVFGLWRRATDGTMRDAAPSNSAPSNSAPSNSAPSNSAPSGSPDAYPVSVDRDTPPAALGTPDRAHHGGEVLTAQQIGVPLGHQATFVQFSSAFCQPCRATRLILQDVTAQMPGVAHVEIDAESHMDLVRHLDVRRTPTLLLLDGSGAIRKRATGLPRKSDVLAALAQVV